MADFENNELFVSLSKMMGCKIKDIYGYVDDPFDNGALVFQICSIKFENGKSVSVEGENDIAYLPANDEIRELSEEVFKILYTEDE